MSEAGGDASGDEPIGEHERALNALRHNSHLIRRSGRLFGGLVDDVNCSSTSKSFRRKLPFYLTDFTDFWRERLPQSLAAVIAIFFSNLTHIITFGAVMERATQQQIAAIENVISGAICGITFALFSGQPLTILGATGPALIFEKVVYDWCTANDWEFLPFRFWMGCWIALFFFMLIALDASALVGFLTRFTEEGFATLVSIAFIVQACQKIYEISYDAPITWRPQDVIDSTCYCLLERPNDPNNETQGYLIKNLSIGVTRCRALGGVPQGFKCFFKPDILMFSVLLALCTYYLSMKLNTLRDSPFFVRQLQTKVVKTVNFQHQQARHAIADFGVVIAVVVFTIVSSLVGLEVPSLRFPLKLQPTMERSWLVDIWAIPDITIVFYALIPAAFFTILLVMDQHLCAGIVNRKDNRLKHGYGYHLDLLVLMCLILVCGALGLPFYAASPVLTVTHVDVLKSYSAIVAPGERPRVLGVKEQRLTALIAHLFIGVSLFFTAIVKLVPMPVLTGVFLYVGIQSLLGQQFVQRIALLFMPQKNQPDYAYLRTVRMNRVHLFTLIQAICVLILFILRYTATVAIGFPLMLVIMVVLRTFVLERLFTANELLSLDDQLPATRILLKPSRSRSRSSSVSQIQSRGALRTSDVGLLPSTQNLSSQDIELAASERDNVREAPS